MATSEVARPRSGAVLTAPFRIRERARWSDVDAAGIMCYGAYLRFFELAETELFRAAGLPIATLPERYGLWLVRRRVDCEFHQPVKLDEEVEIAAHVAGLGRTSVELQFFAAHVGEQELVAQSLYVAVAVDHEHFEPVTLPDAVREALVTYLLTPGNALERLGWQAPPRRSA